MSERKPQFGSFHSAKDVLTQVVPGQALITTFFMVFSLLFSLTVSAKGPYLSDILDTFADVSHMDVCGDCHADWTGANARGDLAVNYKIWDFNEVAEDIGMSSALRRVDAFNVGHSNEWKVLYQSSGGVSNPAGEPYPFSGAADKDRDGYINLVYRTERAGMPININSIKVVTKTNGNTGGNTGALPDHPYGWDLDDNDPLQGNVPIIWADMLTQGAINNPDAITVQQKLATFFSNDVSPPSHIEDLRVDMRAIDDPALNPVDFNTGPGGLGQMPSDRILVAWSAPSDDSLAGGEVDLNGGSVHHYDLRYTTETVMARYNTFFPNNRCSALDPDRGGVDKCHIRHVDHWHAMAHISDCGLASGGSQPYLGHLGPADGNSCVTAGGNESFWNHGYAAPLMRALYESGVEDYLWDGTEVLALTDASGNPRDTTDCTPTDVDPNVYSPGCYPHPPRDPGEFERYTLRQVTDKMTGTDPVTGLPYHNTTQLVSADQHDGLQVQPNYVSPGIVYWLQMLSDAANIHVCVETVDERKISTYGDHATTFCKEATTAEADAISTTVYEGPFVGGGSGLGFHSYMDPGFQEHGNVIAMRAGGGSLKNGNAISGIGISSITGGDIVGDATPPAVLTIDGVGFADYFGPAAVSGLPDFDAPSTIVLTNETVPMMTVRCAGVVTYINDRQLTVAFDVTTATGCGLSAKYSVEIRDPDGLASAVWLGAVYVASTSPGNIHFASSGVFTVAEDGGTASIGVERSGGNYGEVTAWLDTGDVDDTAKDVTDYINLTTDLERKVYFADQASGTIVMPVVIIDDSDPAADVFLTVALSGVTGDSTIISPDVTAPSLISPSTGTLTIENDDADAGDVTFSATPYNVNEPTAGYTISLVRSGTAGDATVLFSTLVAGAGEGFAVPGVGGDYTEVTDFLVQFLNGFTTPLANPTVDILDDANLEPNEIFTVKLASGTGGLRVNGDSGDGTGVLTETVTILDDDTPTTLQFESSSYAVDEASGTTAAVISIVRSGKLVDELHATYSTSSGTAVTTGTVSAGERDYEPQASGDQVLIWLAGEGGSREVTITINEDAVDEVDSENFNITLEVVTGYTAELAGTNPVSVSITDNDTTLQFSAASFSVDEVSGGSTATVTVTRTDLTAGSTFPGNVSVQYYTTDDSALSTGTIDNANGDYDFVPVPIASPVAVATGWPSGDGNPKTISVVINDDTRLEGVESFFIDLVNVNGTTAGQAQIGSVNQTTVTINDDEAPGVVRFVSATYTRIEDDPSGALLATITVERVGGTTGLVTVAWATVAAGSTAEAGGDINFGLDDYVPDSSGASPLSWDNEGGTLSFNVTVKNDAYDEVEEYVNLALSAPTLDGAEYLALLTAADDGSITPRATAKLLIEDSHGFIQIDSLIFNVSEDGDDGIVAQTLVNVTVSRVGGSFGAASVSYLTTDGVSASAAVSTGADNTGGLRDFEPILATSLDWVAGNNDTQSFNVTINNDAIDEPTAETFTLDLSAVSGAWLDASKDQAVIRIIDSVGYIEFTTSSYLIKEDGGNGAISGIVANIYATRIGGSNGVASAVFATGFDEASTYPAVTGGGAGLNDYDATTATLTWNNDVSGLLDPFTVAINYDEVIESTEDVLLSLGSFSGAWAGSLITAQLKITDSIGVFEYVSAPYVIEEAGVSVPITVQRLKGSGGDVNLGIVITDAATNGATLGQDYNAFTGSLTWTGGSTGARSFYIPVLEDTLIEVDEQIDIAVTPPYGPILNTTLTITNDDYAGKVRFVNLPASAREDVGTFNVSIERYEGSIGLLEVDVVATGITADGADFTADPVRLTWNDGISGPQDYPITLLIDGVIEPGSGETIDVNLSIFSGGVDASITDPNPSTLTIIDIDSTGIIEFESVTYEVVEDDPNGTDGANVGKAKITVLRSGGDAGAASVDFATIQETGGTAATGGGTDFTTTSGTLTWADTQSGPRSFYVPITVDGLIESDETLTLNLTNTVGAIFPVDPTTSVAFTELNTTLTIIDAYGFVQFDSASYQVVEDGSAGAATITVTRTGGSNGAASVVFNTVSGGSADPAADYTETTATVSWADGNSDPMTVTVPITLDAVDELDETIAVALSLANNSWLGAPSSANVTIIDSIGTLQFEVTNTPTIIEDDPTTGGKLTINVSRKNGSNGPISVDFSVASGTAAAGTDFNLISVLQPDGTTLANTLNWGDRDVASKSFEVSIVDDAEVEPDQDFTVAINNPLSSLGVNVIPNLGSPLVQTKTIIDSYGKLQFSALEYTVSEGGVAALVTVDRFEGSNGVASIDYSTADITALTAEGDYTIRSGSFSWVDGDGSSREISIPITADNLLEGEETFSVTLSAASGAWAGALNPAVVIINDNPGLLQFSKSSFDVDENAVTVTIVVARSVGAGGAASVNYATTDGTAKNIAATDGDYDVATGTLSWLAGDFADKSFTVVIYPDNLSEGNESINLTLSEVSGASLGSQWQSTVTISDDPGKLQFSAANYNVSEDGTLTAEIIVQRVEGRGGSAAVNYATADITGSALAGTDYTASSGTLNWANDDGADKNFSVVIVKDSITEDPDEKIALNLSVFVGAVGGALQSAELTIIDSAGQFSFTTVASSVTESTVIKTIDVQRLGGTNGTATVTFAISGGTAISPDDYDAPTSSTTTLTFTDDVDVSKTIELSIKADTLVEGDETIELTLISSTVAAIDTSKDSHVLTIIDDDIAGVFEFVTSITGLTVNGRFTAYENTATISTVEVFVNRRVDSLGAVSVDVVVAPGTAHANTVDDPNNTSGENDFLAETRTLSWVDGQSGVQSFLVTINPDSIIEAAVAGDGEVVNLTLTNPTNGATLGGQKTADLHIIDSVGSLRFKSTDFPVNEADGSVNVIVERIYGSGGVVAVDFATLATGSASAGADYTSASGTLEWASGNTLEQAIVIVILNDNDIELDETINVELGNTAGGATVIGTNPVTVTISSDDANGVVQFGAATYSEFEDVGIISITLQRVGGTVGKIAVTYQTSKDSTGSNPATAGTDYVVIEPTRVEWLANKNDDWTFNVQIPAGDIDFENDETFLITLSNLENTVKGTPDTAVVTIVNDDSATLSTFEVNPGWHMISLPTNLLSNNDAVSLFGDDLGWPNIFIFEHISDGYPSSFSGNYQIATTLIPGKGYFFENNRTVPVVLDDQFNGVQSIDPFQITLLTGGGMIGNPFQADIDVKTQVLICNVTKTPSCAPTDWYSWEYAASPAVDGDGTGRPWVVGTMYRYNSQATTYEMLNPSTATMIIKPWEGYWVRTETNDILYLRFYNTATLP